MRIPALVPCQGTRRFSLQREGPRVPVDQPLDLRKLAGILGMLGSAQDNEVLAAARLAHRLIREAGTTWRAVLVEDGSDPDAFGAQQVIEHPERGRLAPPVGRTWKDTLVWLCGRHAGQDARENEFLDDLSRRLSALHGYGAPFISPAQAAWVVDVYERFAAPVNA